MVLLQFVWDERKAKENLKKHGVSFQEASSVFYDENAYEYYDINHSEAEDRFLMLGISYYFRLILVSYCHGETDRIIRIISARKPTRNESEDYTR
jgi:uncharacterized DUF497 family protein